MRITIHLNVIHTNTEEHVYSIHEKNLFKYQFCDKKLKLMKIYVVWCMMITIHSNVKHANIEEHVYSIHEKSSFICQLCDKKFKVMKFHVALCIRITRCHAIFQ